MSDEAKRQSQYPDEERIQFLEEVNAYYAELREHPEAWEESQRELRQWPPIGGEVLPDDDLEWYEAESDQDIERE